MNLIDSYTVERFGAEVASLNLALRITRQDGVEIGLTDHDRNVRFGGTDFLSVPGMTMGSLTVTSDLAPDFAEFRTAFDERGLTETDVRTGRYAEARAEIWRFDSLDPAARMLISAGTVGEIEVREEALVLEYRGQTQALAKVAGRLYQKSCDAQLGDTRCGVDLQSSAYTASCNLMSVNGSVLKVAGLDGFANDLFVGGTLTIEEGPFLGLKRSIRTQVSLGLETELRLWEPLEQSLEVPLQLKVAAGCNKRFTTCRDRFSNQRRFRGFPTIPGVDVLAVETGPRS